MSSHLIRNFLLLLAATTLTLSAERTHRKFCHGTNNGMSHNDVPAKRLKVYRQRYENCTYVNGNLEIVFLPEADLSFLQDIEEVTGYVLIFSVVTDHLYLDNLSIIRGNTQINCSVDGFKGSCSLYIGSTYNPIHTGLGLQELRLTSLKEIMAGDVHLSNNKELCFRNSTNWDDIFSNGASKIHLNNSNGCSKECHKSCDFKGQRYCWGEGPEMCQQLTKVICSPQCGKRCRGPEPNECCHIDCAGSCTGPSNAECLACRNFENDGKCEPQCPPETIYDQGNFKFVDNPDVRYAYGSVCLKECPAHLSTDTGACVKQCTEGKHIVNKKCVECSGPCPKSCRGTSEFGLTSNNIEEYKDCKIIQGNLIILNIFHFTDPHDNTVALTAKHLERLETVEEITGSLQIQVNLTEIESLSFLRNLKIIRGLDLLHDRSSLSIMNTKLISMGLNSLKEISYGNIEISSNIRLCYVQSIMWSHLQLDPDNQKVSVKRNNPDCKSLNMTCSPQCSDLGCWGPSDTECLSCRHFQLDYQCVESCSSVPLAYEKNNNTCASCHGECADSCTGENATDCIACLHVKNDLECVMECPISKYTSPRKTCEPCHEYCGGYGCTGPLNIVGPGGCNSCDLVSFADLINRDNVTGCLNPTQSTCSDGHFKILLHEYPENHTLYKKFGCKQCHNECLLCEEYSILTDRCRQCRNYRQEGKCVPSCSDGFYLDASSHSQLHPRSVVPKKGVRNDIPCNSCNPTCLSCHGPKPSDCYTCKNYLIYLDETKPDKGFNCTEKCPELIPYKVSKEVNGTKITLCVAEDTNESSFRTKLAVSLTAAIAVLIAIIVISVVCAKVKKTKAKSKVMMAAAQLLEGKIQPVEPSGIKGDNSKVDMISERDLRLGEKIGAGAFGSVYKGIWSPPIATCRVYVAIKIAHSCFGNQTDDVLDEVKVMSTLSHEHCIKILGICLAARIMIITQLMPYGCMLKFIQENKANIGSKVLLNWAMQIAKGMAYLESKDIIHRDLAARNVLVQNDNHVRITDFGLSKILKGRDYYKSEGGRFPIKWLALESLQHKQFTHKSDVWSYGVTLWEMFTYGEKPYDRVDAREMVDFLEKGDRLAQPPICTIDVYMVMIKCWLVDADSRPSFLNLVETFTAMAKDPARFLVIQDDQQKELKSTEPVAILRQLSTIDDNKPVVDASLYLARKDFNGDIVTKTKMSSSSSLDDEPRPHMNQIGAVHKRPGSFKSKGKGGHANRPDQLAFFSPSGTENHLSRQLSSPTSQEFSSPSMNNRVKSRGSVGSRRYMPDPCDNEQKGTRNEQGAHRYLPGNLDMDGDDYLEPEKTPDDKIVSPVTTYFPTTTPFVQPRAFSNPLYHPFIPDEPNSYSNGKGIVQFKNNKIDEPHAAISLARQESDTANEVFDDESHPTSELLPKNVQNNNDYYNDFFSSSKSKNYDFSKLGV